MAHSNHGGAANLTGPPVIDEDGLTRQLANGLLEADYVGCGFMLVRREVFLRRLEAFPERPRRRRLRSGVPSLAPWFYDLDPDGIEPHGTHGEDVGFCRLWRSIGGEIWVDTAIKLTHVGMHDFTADPMKLLAADAEVDEAV